jgi:regulator of cell morphogenesis and NO signaling
MEFAQKTLAGIVTNDHRTAAVLEKYHLDFCCKGKITLADACSERGLSTDLINEELEQVTDDIAPLQMPFAEMNAEQLISHILVHHHFYVRQSMPQIYSHLEKVAVKHGDHFPNMKEVFRLFSILRVEMNQHITKEEAVLFPAIRNAALAIANGQDVSNAVQIMTGAIAVMEAEHDEAGSIMEEIRLLTNDYKDPEGACNTFKLSLAELKYFENDLHKHVHLENHILFPMAKQMN